MKIVVNKCYGGFGVSAKCLYELIKRKSKAVEIVKAKDWWSNKDDIEKEIREEIERSKYRGKSKNLKLPKGWIVNWTNCIIDTKKKIVYRVDKYNQDYDVRTDPDLIELIEKKGTKWANGEHANLQITEIPDGVEYTVEEYDGQEWIAEKHRTW